MNDLSGSRRIMDVISKENHEGNNVRVARWKQARAYTVVCILSLTVFGVFLNKMEVHKIVTSEPNFVQEQLYDFRAPHHHKNIIKSLREVDEEELMLLLPQTWLLSDNMTRLNIGAMSHRATSCGPTHPDKTTVTLASIVRGLEAIPWTKDNSTSQAVNIVVGDVLVFLLEARDAKGQQRISGGDYWHAVMKDANGTASVIGRIFDHDNGRYTLHFLAAWSGVIRLSITLVHPSDFANWLKTEYLHTMRGPSWSGIFQLGNLTEKSSCRLSLDASWTEKCVAMSSNALQYSRLICDPPKTLPCDSLTSMSASGLSYIADMKNRLPKSRKQFLKAPYLYATIANVPEGILVTGKQEKEEHLLSDESLELPSCQPDMHVPLVEGYWWNKTWFSLTCGPRVPLTKATVQTCLRGFNVFFLGDSTTRQWFAAFTDILGLGRKEDHERVFTLRRRDEEGNLNLTFYFHPLTVHPTSVRVNISTVKFEADVILELPRHCRNVVVFSPWAHFCIWQWEAYIDWLKGIRAAILGAKQRCPDLIVVAKSPHPVNNQLIKPGRDFIFSEMRKLMRTIFKDIGVIFLDIWDMDLASPWPIILHMPNDVINQEASMLLSYLCPLLKNVDKNHPS